MPIMVKTLRKLRRKGNSVPGTNSYILKRDKLNSILLRLTARQECPVSSLLFDITLEVLESAIRKEKYIRQKY